MSDNPYKVQLLSDRETDEFLAKMSNGFGPENSKARRTLVLPGGLELKGSFELTARDANSNEVEWQHADENLITDLGRRAWADLRLSSYAVGFAPSTETPHTLRSALCTDPAQTFISAGLAQSNVPATHTKTVSATFTVPASNRTLGTIFIGPVSGNVNILEGPTLIYAYALLTPARVQTTTQTLEVVYKISMTPVV